MSTPVNPSAAEIEAVIRSLVNITSARVITDRIGNIEEIHVLTDSSRMPKQVARDIESALIARFNLTDFDHKKISIAQTQMIKQVKPVDHRLKILDVSTSINGVKSEAIVRLLKEEETYTGIASGPGSGKNQVKLLALATLRATENCGGSDGILMLEDVNPSVTVSGRTAVMVCVSHPTRYGEDFLVGSAIVKQDLSKAVVNATLDAVNRRLSSIGEQ